MSYSTWHTYGYGVCVSEIKEPPVDLLQNLISMAPVYQRKIQEWLDDCEISEPTYEDYVDFDQDFGFGLATILKEVISEAENIELEACDSYDEKTYLLYCPEYPWNQTGHKQLTTEDAAIELFQKYVSVLTDEPIDIDYQSVENGG